MEVLPEGKVVMDGQMHKRSCSALQRMQDVIRISKDKTPGELNF